MSAVHARRATGKSIILLAVLTMLAATLTVSPARGQGEGLSVPETAVPDKVESPYIVMMADDPVIAYEGGIRGLAATDPGDGRLNPNAGNVRRYQAYLNGRHADALAEAGAEAADKFYDYTVTFNGFAAMLTGAEVAALEGRSDVLAVWPDELRRLETDRSDDYLDMPAIWDTFGGVENAGEDIIVGVLDTGIDPDNPSFSESLDLIDAPGNSGKRNLAYGPPPSHWTGTCQSGELWSQDECTNKIIGAQYFKDGFSNLSISFSGDYLSARDFDGHGSHTAGTAAGNVVETVLPNGDTATIAGMAPRARIAVYKVCWANAGCALTDLVAAIDQAVADGVDVINYSIGSSAQSFTGADDIAFLFAADAGVFVATSNGNSGPGANTTGSPSSAPWLTSVGAVDHGRNFLGSATTGDGVTYSGASLNDTEVTGSIVDSDAAGSQLCIPGELDPSVVSGNIVLCRRGAIARVAKSAAVAEAGGIGMIMWNPSPNSLNADRHSVPSLHVDHVDGPLIRDYVLNAADPVVTIHVGGELGVVNDGVMAGFSSRGLGASSDIVKPDIIAPGVNVLAPLPATTFFGPNPTGSGFLSGTSMASPHIAGIGALVKAAHPDWSPAAIKSALMTTADPDGILKEDQLTPANALDQGSGLVQPLAALDPGLVYDAGFLDYVGFLCGNSSIVSASFCDLVGSLGFPFDGSDLNQPNIAVGELAGVQTVTRTVTNVGPAATYSVSVDAPAGINVAVSPASLTLGEGESASYEVTFSTTTSAAIGSFAYGSLTWSHGPHDVTSQLAVRPVQAAFPSSIQGSGTDGTQSFDVEFGYSGDYTAAAHGLVPATQMPGNVVDDPTNDINQALDSGVGVTFHFVDVPAGSAYARFSLFDDFTDGDDDLDLYVFGPDTAGFPFVGGSGSPTSAEQVDVAFPDPGTYIVVVHGWQTDGPDSNYTLFSWSFGPDLGNMTVTGPAAATLGTTESISVTWTGLAAGQKYLGAVSHSDSGGIFGLTLVEIDS